MLSTADFFINPQTTRNSFGKYLAQTQKTVNNRCAKYGKKTTHKAYDKQRRTGTISHHLNLGQRLRFVSQCYTENQTHHRSHQN